MGCRGGEVHDDGEVYAAIVWRLMELFEASTISRDALFRTWVDGMNYTLAGPAWEDMRDGMLQSAAATRRTAYFEWLSTGSTDRATVAYAPALPSFRGSREGGRRSRADVASIVGDELG